MSDTPMDDFVLQAKAAAATALEAQQQIAIGLADMQAKLATVNAISTDALAAKTKIADDQAVIATKSDHIQKAQEHADKVRGDLDRTLTVATQSTTDAEGLKSRVQSAADSTTQLVSDIAKAKSAAENDATAISEALNLATHSSAITKGLAEKSSTIETQLTQYERKLGELSEQCDAQLATIIGLLPGATSAGLAHAFDIRRQSFLKPQKYWQWLFVGSVLVLVALAVSGLWHVYVSNVPLTYDELLRLWLARLPVAGALVWLALHASRESALAKRLEEDYGYKAAIAASFQGFHRQMSEVGTGILPNSPLAKLCEDTLSTLATPPGRIYDKHELAISPTSEIQNAIKALAESLKVGSDKQWSANVAPLLFKCASVHFFNSPAILDVWIAAVYFNAQRVNSLACIPQQRLLQVISHRPQSCRFLFVSAK